MRFTIQRLSELLGVSQSTIRRCEERGLIRVERSEDSGYRHYSVANAAELSIYLCMQRQTFSRGEIILSRKAESFAQYDRIVSEKLDEIDRDIHRLEMARKCWKNQLALTRLLYQLKEAPEHSRLIRYPEILLDPIEEARSLFFSLVRQNDPLFSTFRLCNVFARERVEALSPGHRQAFFAMADDLPAEVVAQSPGVVQLPAREYLAFYSEGAGLIDDEEPDADARSLLVMQAIREKLGQGGFSLCGDVLAIVVNLTPGDNRTIVLAPVGA